MPTCSFSYRCKVLGHYRHANLLLIAAEASGPTLPRERAAALCSGKYRLQDSEPQTSIAGDGLYMFLWHDVTLESAEEGSCLSDDCRYDKRHTHGRRREASKGRDIPAPLRCVSQCSLCVGSLALFMCEATAECYHMRDFVTPQTLGFWLLTSGLLAQPQVTSYVVS
jgi:hypothetical protein